MSENNNKFTEPVDETVNTDYTANRYESKNLAPKSQLLNYLDIANINVGFIATVKSKTIAKTCFAEVAPDNPDDQTVEKGGEMSKSEKSGVMSRTPSMSASS